MISPQYKAMILNWTKELVGKVVINDEVEVTQINIKVYPDSLTGEINLPQGMIVNKIEFIDLYGVPMTTITGLNIDTSVSTVFSHNIQFVQGGGW